ncbi:MAG: peptidase S58 [Leptothrix sp. (in: Bacteria)]|nr:peptidase S58 [Leptothrix sp. (in: b-proteobacteria)]
MAPAPGSIADVAGITVGHAAVTGRPTGCSVVLCPQGAVAGVAQRGGAPGTRETDLLRPENSVQHVHAVLLTGGSAFGLDAAGGVMRWLDQNGHGYVVGSAAAGRVVRVPIVPAAVLFDLWLGDARIRPGADTGYAACVAASASPPPQGSVGAGLGATVGKLFGIERAMKGGVGTASLRLGRCTVGALVAVNALGDVVDAHGRVLAGARSEDGRALLGSTTAVLAGAGPAAMMAGTATTIGVVATDAVLTKSQATQLAGLAHHGLSRAVSPVTPHDGDTLFALATGTAGAPGDLNALGVLAAEVVARAIRNAVLAARAVPAGDGVPHLPAAGDLHAAG